MAKRRSEQPQEPRGESPLDFTKHGDGINDPKLVLEEPLFGGILGTELTRRTLLKAGALAAFSGAAAFSSKKGWADKKFDPVVRVGYLPITDAAALLVAHEMGFFKQEGLDSVRPTLVRGWSEIVEAFQAHKFNLVHLLNPIPLWMRYNNKFPVKITAWDHTNGSAVVVGAHTGITSFKDLGGKQLAVPYWYSNHNIIAQICLRDAGITPVIRPQDAKLAPNECNLLVLAPPDMPPALAARKIDGYFCAEPFNALGELKAGAKMLRFTADIWKGHPCCVVSMHEADVMDPARAAWTQGIHNAVVAAQLYMAENRKATAQMLSKDGKNYIPFPFEVVDRAMNFYDPAYYKNPLAIKHVEWHQSRINFQAWPYPSATRVVADQLRKLVVTGDKTFMDKLSTDFVVKDLLDYSYIKKSLENHPKWRDDLSVPQTGDPFTRVETIEV